MAERQSHKGVKVLVRMGKIIYHRNILAGKPKENLKGRLGDLVKRWTLDFGSGHGIPKS